MYNFPYSDKRQNQPFVLNEIAEAYNSGYKHIILEAPTGFGKSAVAVAVALTMGSIIFVFHQRSTKTIFKRFPLFGASKRKE